MPKFNPRDTDWKRIEHMQNTPESGKGRNARGGNFRVSPKEFAEGMDRVKSSACDMEYCAHWVDKRIRLNCNKHDKMCDVINCEWRKDD